MHRIIITTPHYSGFAGNDEFVLKDSWQKESPSDYLKFFLLANFPLKVRNVGMPDEEFKTLQFFGQVVWEEGQTEVRFWGNRYEVTMKDEL